MAFGNQSQIGFLNQIVAALQACNTIINKNGIFVYSPTPGPNNLVVSITPTSGGATFDGFGNRVIPGITSYVFGFGVWFALQHSGINLVWKIGGATQSVAYTTTGIIGEEGFGGTFFVSIQPALFITGNSSVAGGTVYLGPSGDVTGATDAVAINNFLTAGTSVVLMAGTWYINATLNVSSSASIAGTPGSVINPTVALPSGMINLSGSNTTITGL